MFSGIRPFLEKGEIFENFSSWFGLNGLGFGLSLEVFWFGSLVGLIGLTDMLVPISLVDFFIWLGLAGVLF